MCSALFAVTVFQFEAEPNTANPSQQTNSNTFVWAPNPPTTGSPIFLSSCHQCAVCHHSGSYDTGATSLQAGQWYVASYCQSTGQISGGCMASYAVGIGHEPSGVAALSASLSTLFACMLALLALLL